MSSNDGILKAINPIKNTKINMIAVAIVGPIHSKLFGTIIYTPTGSTAAMTILKNSETQKRL